MTQAPTTTVPASPGGGRWTWALAVAGCAAALVVTVASWRPSPVDAVGTSAAPVPAEPSQAVPAAPTSGIPASLAIPALGITAAVEAVGTGSDGALQLPADPTRLGWYGAGARPGGSDGSAVVAGHLDRPGGELGPLAELVRARPGTEVLVTDDAGVTRSFEIRRLEVVEREALYLADPFRAGGEAVLTLITCTGTFDRARGVYPSNLVVTAVQRA